MRRSLTIALLAMGGCVFSVEGEIPDIEVTQPDIQFPGFPAGAVAGEPALAIPVAHMHDRLGVSQDGFSEVRVREVAISAKSGVADLGFVRALRISITPGGARAAGAEPVEIARYERTVAPDAVGPVLRMRSDPAVNVIDSWRSDVVTVLFEVSGDLPEVNWSVDFAVRYQARLTLDE